MTDQGPIEADYVVNAGGMWAREIGAMAGVAVPLHACEHFYIVTEGIDGLTSNLPVLRVPDECAYYKEDAGKDPAWCLRAEFQAMGHERHPRGFRV
jgi:4-methylaminobutanoate oxidase (formaldehyde-forming)